MPSDNFIFAIFKSFGLHLFIGVALVASVSFTALEKPKPKVIQIEPISSVAVDKNKLAQQVKRIQTAKDNKRKAEEKRVKDLESRAARAKNRTRNEEKQLNKLAKQTRKSKADKRRADLAAKKAREKQKREDAKAAKATQQANQKLKEKAAAEKALADAQAKRRKDEANVKKARAEKLRKEKLAKAEAARKVRAAKERAEQEAALQQQMAEEQAARERVHQRQVLSEVDKYKALIHQRIQQNLIVDESMKGKSCRLNINLAFNGLVTSVNILGGDRTLCSAAQNAVLKTTKLPVSDDPAVFEQLKNINLTVEPEL